MIHTHLVIFGLSPESSRLRSRTRHGVSHTSVTPPSLSNFPSVSISPRGLLWTFPRPTPSRPPIYHKHLQSKGYLRRPYRPSCIYPLLILPSWLAQCLLGSRPRTPGPFVLQPPWRPNPLPTIHGLTSTIQLVLGRIVRQCFITSTSNRTSRCRSLKVLNLTCVPKG